MNTINPPWTPMSSNVKHVLSLNDNLGLDTLLYKYFPPISKLPEMYLHVKLDGYWDYSLSECTWCGEDFKTNLFLRDLKPIKHWLSGTVPCWDFYILFFYLPPQILRNSSSETPPPLSPSLPDQIYIPYFR